ncbi:Uncharacterized protein APZ42_014402 [Daphnia magna]|uniref:Uncharacterized protein n=1 Tax=Daphnia magna TaxID=35525 RepID=A0A162PXW4_9CRUS|nr:Uncharacterized protein APZ42_014402 [Daphnia magna]
MGQNRDHRYYKCLYHNLIWPPLAWITASQRDLKVKIYFENFHLKFLTKPFANFAIEYCLRCYTFYVVWCQDDPKLARWD